MSTPRTTSAIQNNRTQGLEASQRSPLVARPSAVQKFQSITGFAGSVTRKAESIPKPAPTQSDPVSSTPPERVRRWWSRGFPVQRSSPQLFLSRRADGGVNSVRPAGDCTAKLPRQRVEANMRGVAALRGSQLHDALVSAETPNPPRSTRPLPGIEKRETENDDASSAGLRPCDARQLPV